MSEQIRPEVLISRLTSPNESWRVDAEARLVSLGETAVPALIGALRHANPAVRLHAAYALGRIGNAAAIPAMISALEDTENNAAVAIAAEKALISWGEDVKGGLLRAALQGPPHVRPRAVRAQAASALGQIAGARAVEAISPLLDDRDKWVRYEVAEALVHLGSVRGKSVLEQAREDPEEEGSYLRRWADELLDEIEELKRTGRAIA